MEQIILETEFQLREKKEQYFQHLFDASKQKDSSNRSEGSIFIFYYVIFFIFFFINFYF
jgi:hypothetical protein